MISALISRLIILSFGTLYPAYASYKAVRTKNVKEYVKWMMYWIVYAFFTCFETFTDIFLSWFPFYYEVKVIIVLWLLSPATKGSSTLYRKFVHPTLTRREQEIDEYINQAKERGYTAVLQLGSKGVNYATNVIMQTAIKAFKFSAAIINQVQEDTVHHVLMRHLFMNGTSTGDRMYVEYSDDEEFNSIQTRPPETWRRSEIKKNQYTHDIYSKSDDDNDLDFNYNNHIINENSSQRRIKCDSKRNVERSCNKYFSMSPYDPNALHGLIKCRRKLREAADIDDAFQHGSGFAVINREAQLKDNVMQSSSSSPNTYYDNTNNTDDNYDIIDYAVAPQASALVNDVAIDSREYLESSDDDEFNLILPQQQAKTKLKLNVIEDQHNNDNYSDDDEDIVDDYVCNGNKKSDKTRTKKEKERTCDSGYQREGNFDDSNFSRRLRRRRK